MASAYKWHLQLYKYFCKPVYLGHITQSIWHEYQNREQVFESSFHGITISIRKYRMQHMFLQRYTVVAVGIYDEICKIEEQIDSPRKRNLVQLNILPGASKVLEICAVAASPRVPGILNRLVCFPIPLSVWKSVGAWKNRWSQGKSRNEPRRHQVIGLLSTTWLEDASHRDAWKGETIAPRDICVSEERKLNWKPRGLGRRVACLPCPLYRGKISTNIFCYFNLETLSRGKLCVLKKLGNSNWYLFGFKDRELQIQMRILTNGQFWKKMLPKMKK